MPLEDPEIISQEDFFHHDGPEPRRRFRMARDDPESARELDRYLHDWLVVIQRSQART